jgi:iron complex outermembrane receptor protein
MTGPRRAAPALGGLLLLLAGLPAAADLAGRVLGAAGRPVPQARIEAAGGPPVFTDARGAFTLPGVEPPVELVVSHPRFETARAAVDGAGPVEVVLQPKREVYDTIEVSAALGQGVAVPPTLAVSELDPADLAAPPATLAEALATVPAVAESGQGGIFQVFSIRGVGGHRVLTRVAGVPLTGERRAGVETSFLDPLLIGTVEVVRGPSSTYHGSGALGGVVEVFPRRREGWSAEAGWASQGDERWGGAGWGGGGWSLAAVWRAADDAETAGGERLFSRYERAVAALERAWGGDGTAWRLTVVPSVTRDIGKPNTDFPGRVTVYPEEEHLLSSVTGTFAGGWRASAWLHPHDVATRTTEADGSGALVDAGNVDLGAAGEREWVAAPRLALRTGVEYVGRLAVDAEEIDRGPDGRLVAQRRPLDGASQHDAAAFASAAWTLPRATLEAGARFTSLSQHRTGAGAFDDTAWNGFAGAVVPLPGGFQVTGNLGTGMRWPTLSERFFSGTTGRGEVVANAALAPERSLHGDLGVHWFGRRLHLAVHAFRNEIDDFIEQVEVGPDVTTFVNLTQGTLEGLEAEGFYQLAPGWLLAWGGHAIAGEDAAGRPLADVPAARAFASLAAGPRDPALGGPPWSGRLRLEHRTAVDDPGPGEKPIPDATLLSATLARRLGGGLELTLSGSNLTAATWLPSADRKAVPGPGRSLGVALRWTGAPRP